MTFWEYAVVEVVLEVEVGFGWLGRNGGGGVVSGSRKCECILTCDRFWSQLGWLDQPGRGRLRDRAFGGGDGRAGGHQGSLGKEHGASNAVSRLPKLHYPPMHPRRVYKLLARGPGTCGTCGTLGVSASGPPCVLSSMAGLEEGEWKVQRRGGKTYV